MIIFFEGVSEMNNTIKIVVSEVLLYIKLYSGSFLLTFDLNIS